MLVVIIITVKLLCNEMLNIRDKSEVIRVISKTSTIMELDKYLGGKSICLRPKLTTMPATSSIFWDMAIYNIS